MATSPKKDSKADKVSVMSPKAKRVLQKPEYKSLRLQKRIRHPKGAIVGSFRLMKGNILHVLRHKRLFFGISFVYFVLSLILVSGLIGGSDLTATKDVLEGLFTGSGAQLGAAASLFSILLSGGAGGTVSDGGSVYQTLLLVIVSLATIWALRQTYAKVKVTTKQSFYKSMMPLVPFVVVLAVIGLQFVPLLAASSIFTVVISLGLAVTIIERVLWGSLVFCVVVLTLYMVSSSIFALYIVTLPDVTPMQALRSARELVRYRRWSIMRKVIFLPICLIIFAAVIMLPILLYATFMAQWVFIFLTMIALVVIHGYMYRLYRELL